jgi:hypothetical protein
MGLECKHGKIYKRNELLIFFMCYAFKNNKITLKWVEVPHSKI